MAEGGRRFDKESTQADMWTVSCFWA